jgi:hypothetical protein
MRVAATSLGLSLAASKNFLRACALSGPPDKAHYPDSGVIRRGTSAGLPPPGLTVMIS